MNLHLEHQTVVVAGAARGIGRGIAETFAEEKANVALMDRDASIEATAAEISQEHGVRCTGWTADVGDYQQIQVARDSISQQFGRIDHVVFAVGIGSGKFGFPFWNLKPGDWEQVLRINVIGAVNIAHAFVDSLKKADEGSLIFLASVSGQIGSQTDPPYSASKAALINFSQCAAKDLAPFGVRVNAVCPGMVKTALNQSIWQAWADQQDEAKKMSYEEWASEKIKKVVPLGRWQEAADIARMVVFLASKRARNITGQTINVDGGFVMHW